MQLECGDNGTISAMVEPDDTSAKTHVLLSVIPILYLVISISKQTST